MCLYPKQVPVVLKNGHMVHINCRCGKCIECLKLRTHDWAFRMKYEIADSKFAVFVTLTYDDCLLPSNGVEVRHIQLLNKQLRKANAKFSYYIIGEYGTKTFRPHYHAIYFMKSDNYSFNEFHKLLLDKWRYGFITYSDVNIQRVKYCIAYLIGQRWPQGKNKPFTIMSKRPSIGACALNNTDLVRQWKDNNFDHANIGAKKIHLPRYYRTKLTDSPVDVIDMYLIRCKQHFEELKKRQAYAKLRKLSPVDTAELLRQPFKIRDFVHQDRYKYFMWNLENSNAKDYYLKKRNKKLRND